MSFGGNDIGFSKIVKDCIDVDIFQLEWETLAELPNVAGNIAEPFVESRLPVDVELRNGCGDDEADIVRRIDYLLEPGDDDCTGLRHEGTDDFDCALDIGPRRGSITDFYVDLVPVSYTHLTLPTNREV